MVEKRIKKLYNRLMALGYSPFHVEIILQETIGIPDITSVEGGRKEDIIRVLEQYEKLGTEYMTAYSK
ncbi:hypothetical protein HSX37_18325|uniref:Uncharacterized protein n=1 Tax=Dendrosporobacter quercicolus TaxID=146817 RepID=A0A1H0A0R8_9FIRM|nr:hypothetical protein [Dendrosporobacter quercicolus]NSL49977.1 hypothetical protein [Dendrosporobacter quercicolus DSM 1736]SDN27045.1 hypothetical protein SAMN04488502_11620 [Dendrosporobacter quercicolus]